VGEAMKYIWYEPLIEALRHHIESKHMNQQDALSELSMTEEHFAYSDFGDDEKITLLCPWSEHCNCDWKIEGHIEFKLVRVKQ
jgi:hypothetical protein